MSNTYTDSRGSYFDTSRPYWAIEGRGDFCYHDLLNTLREFLPEDSMLYLEDGTPDDRLLGFFKEHAVPPEMHLAVGTLWPEPECFHIPARKHILDQLAELSRQYAEPELAIHFQVYRDGEILFAWHDAFMRHVQMQIAGCIHEPTVRYFCECLRLTYALIFD